MAKVDPANFNADNLRTTQWVGIVEDTADDIFEGRCKIRVYGKINHLSGNVKVKGAPLAPSPEEAAATNGRTLTS